MNSYEVTTPLHENVLVEAAAYTVGVSISGCVLNNLTFQDASGKDVAHFAQGSWCHVVLAQGKR